MKDTALYFLHKVAERLPENQFVKALFNRLKNAGDSINLDNWKLLDILFDELTLLEDMDYAQIERGQDFRFHNIYLKAFRKFPSCPKNEYFGISFCRKENETNIPESTFLQGGNGTGKTSIFSAMEYLFTGNISAAKKMQIVTEEQLNDYIPFAKGSLNDVDINVSTKSYHYSLGSINRHQNDIRRLCLLPFFCTEYDVDKLIWMKLDRYVYEQMGYSFVKSIIDKLEKEIQEAISHHDELGDSTETIESRIAERNQEIVEMDKEIGMYKSLKSSFLYLVMGQNNKQNWKDGLETLKKYLSEDYVQDSGMSNGKLLNLENLTAEKKAIGSLLGNNAESQYIMQLYSIVESLVLIGTEKLDPLSLSQINRKEDVTGALEEFNDARKIFRQAIADFIDNEKSSDFVSCLEKYDGFLQQLIKKRNDEERETKIMKTELAIFNRYIVNKAIYDEFLAGLKSEVYGTIKTITEVSRNMINEIMDLFVMDDEKMQFGFDEEKGEFKMNITLNVSENDSPISFTPEEYLNTFRYKLYCMTLKLAIAFAMKRFYRMNFPIVIDDIFYSSDFMHRRMVREFFRILVEKHKKMFPKEDLQIIFFSHDEVIIEAAYRGIRYISPQVNRQLLYDYREAKKEDKEEMLVIMGDGQSNNVYFTKLTDSFEL